MKSQEKKSGAGHAFRLVPHSNGKARVGVAAVMAVSSFAFLVFGPLADQRALALAGYAPAGVAVAPVALVAASAPRAEARLARIVSRELDDPR
jgi:hypothetical protein